MGTLILVALAISLIVVAVYHFTDHKPASPPASTASNAPTREPVSNPLDPNPLP